MKTRSPNLRDLSDRLVGVQVYSTSYKYPDEYGTFDDAWNKLKILIGELREKLGESRYEQLLDMFAQAKVHYEAGYIVSRNGKPKPGQPGAEDIKLGSRLLLDMQRLVEDKPPYAYPTDLYRWPIHPGNPDQSEEGVLDRLTR